MKLIVALAIIYVAVSGSARSEVMWCRAIVDSPDTIVFSAPDLADESPVWNSPSGIAPRLFIADERVVHDGTSLLLGGIHYSRSGDASRPISSLFIHEPNLMIVENEWNCGYVDSTQKYENADIKIRNLIVAKLERILFDPYSVRAARISDIFIMHDGNHLEVLAVCLEFNAKNRVGAYTGISVSGFVFRSDGTLFRPTSEWRQIELCSSVNYDEFGELEALGN